MKKIVVTGATGFIGRYVVKELRERVAPERIVLALRDPRIVDGIAELAELETIKLDLNTQEINIHSKVRGDFSLIHLAWQGLPNYKNPKHMTEYLSSQLRFIEKLLQNGLDDLTVAGTCFEYGLASGELTDDEPSKPITYYGLAKKTLHDYLTIRKNSMDFSLKWLRFFYLYGAGQRAGSLFAALSEAIKSGAKVFNMSAGQQVRDFLPVEKAARYFVDAALQTEIEGAINICSGEPVTVQKKVEEILAANNYTLELNLGHYPYPDYEPMAFWGCPEKLRKINTVKQ